MKTNKQGILLFSDRLGLRIVVLVIAVALAAVMTASPALAQLAQEAEQEGESGEIGQSGDVTGSGDNSNQCVALQPVANTGSPQTIITIEQYMSYVEEFDFDDVGSSIEIAPEQIVECDQAVNQAATASDTADPGYCTWSWDDGWWCYWSTDGSWWYQGYDGTWTAYDAGWWYAATGGWWWLGSDGWWWTDGYYWTYYGWDGWTTVSNVSAGALDSTGSMTTLGALGVLGLGATALVIRRTRASESE